MFRLPPSDGQQIPVLWIPSASLSIPVADVSRHDLYKFLDRDDAAGGQDGEYDRLSLLEDAILLNSD